jgi:DNA-binding XRE family transcriptional regulator
MTSCRPDTRLSVNGVSDAGARPCSTPTPPPMDRYPRPPAVRRMRTPLALHHRTPQARRSPRAPIRGWLMAARSSALASRDPKPSTGTVPTDPRELQKELGRALFNRREQRGMTRAGLARRIRYSYQAIYNVERGIKIGSLHFWTRVDPALQANGALLAIFDRIRPHDVPVRPHLEHEPDVPVSEALKLAPYRQVQKINRVFADRLSTTAASRRRCPYMAERAAHQRARIEHEIEALTSTIHTLLRRPDFSPDDVFTDLWQTLLTHDPYHASFLSAAALMALAAP